MKKFFSPPMLLASLALLALPLAHAQTDSALPSYQPHDVPMPKNESYVLKDGSIYIVGDDGMKEILEKFNEAFTKTHPAFRFTMLLKGSSTGIGGLTAGVSAFAPMGREAWATDVSGFREFIGYVPTDFVIGYDAFGPRAGHKSPPGIYVNIKNPLASLTTEQVARILTTGASKGDITHWSQLGLKGEWAKRLIHTYGPRDDGGMSTSARNSLMHKLPFTRNYEGLENGADIIHAVADDPYGIALVGFIDAAKLSHHVKFVSLRSKDGAPFSDASYENVTAGRYPYEPNLHIYVNRAPGKALDPFIKEYLRLVLSREGQAIIEAKKNSDEGFVPLKEHELAAELAKLE